MFYLKWRFPARHRATPSFLIHISWIKDATISWSPMTKETHHWWRAFLGRPFWSWWSHCADALRDAHLCYSIDHLRDTRIFIDQSGNGFLSAIDHDILLGSEFPNWIFWCQDGCIVAINRTWLVKRLEMGPQKSGPFNKHTVDGCKILFSQTKKVSFSSSISLL